MAPRLLCPCDSPGKNAGVGRPFQFQAVFLIQGLSRVSCIGRWVLYRLSPQGSPISPRKVTISRTVWRDALRSLEILPGQPAVATCWVWGWVCGFLVRRVCTSLTHTTVSQGGVWGLPIPAAGSAHSGRQPPAQSIARSLCSAQHFG